MTISADGDFFGMPGGDGGPTPHTAELSISIRRPGKRQIVIKQQLDLGYLADGGGDSLAYTAAKLVRRAWDKQEAEG